MWTRVLHFDLTCELLYCELLLDVEFFNRSCERGACDSQQLGRLNLVAIGFNEGLDY